MSWSLALTPPSGEFRVARTLRQREIPHHLFKIRQRTAYRGITRDRLLPAFRGYLFIAASNQWDFLRDYCGVSRFVSRELPSGIVPSLVGLADSNDVLPTVEIPSCPFKQGQRVHIHGMSLLAGNVAIFENLADNDSAVVLLDWMGRWVPVLVDLRDITSELSGRTRRARRKRNRKRRFAR